MGGDFAAFHQPPQDCFRDTYSIIEAYRIDVCMFREWIFCSKHKFEKQGKLEKKKENYKRRIKKKATTKEGKEKGKFLGVTRCKSQYKMEILSHRQSMMNLL